MDNVKAFNAAVTRYVREVTFKSPLETQRKAVLHGLVGVTDKTPVRDGLARGSWTVTINSPQDGIIRADDTSAPRDKDGGPTVARGMQATSGMKPFGIVYLNNNVEYAIHLEEGTPKMAPFAMVDRTYDELQAMF